MDTIAQEVFPVLVSLDVVPGELVATSSGTTATTHRPVPRAPQPFCLSSLRFLSEWAREAFNAAGLLSCFEKTKGKNGVFQNMTLLDLQIRGQVTMEINT